MAELKGYDLFEVLLRRSSDGFVSPVYMAADDMLQATIQSTAALTDAHYEAQSVKKVGRVYVSGAAS